MLVRTGHNSSVILSCYPWVAQSSKAAVLVSLNKETASILVSQTNNSVLKRFLWLFFKYFFLLQLVKSHSS